MTIIDFGLSKVQNYLNVASKHLFKKQLLGFIFLTPKGSECVFWQYRNFG